MIRVSDCEAPFRAQIHHCEVLHQFAPNSPSSHNEDVACGYLLDHSLAQDHFGVEEGLSGFYLQLFELCWGFGNLG